MARRKIVRRVTVGKYTAVLAMDAGPVPGPLPGQMALPIPQPPQCWCGHIMSHHREGRRRCRAMGCSCSMFAVSAVERFFTALSWMADAYQCCHLLSRAGGTHEQARQRLAKWYAPE